MAQLIQIRQRIKAIETIKKITHAMRLISMSAHSHLKKNDAPLITYTNAIQKLFNTVAACVPHWRNEILYPSPTYKSRTLIIVVGSTKGLCGDFNTSLFRFLTRFLKQHTPANPSYVVIGKKAVDYIKLQNTKPLIAFSHLTLPALPSIAAAITHEIFHTSERYTQVFLISNKMKTFFTRKPNAAILIPLNDIPTQTDASSDYYVWEQNPTAILDALAYQTLEASIYQLLFQSLLAEQAARFISMDSATRNADTILEETRLLYNKMRQTKITTELTELTGTV